MIDPHVAIAVLSVLIAGIAWLIKLVYHISGRLDEAMTRTACQYQQEKCGAEFVSFKWEQQRGIRVDDAISQLRDQLTRIEQKLDHTLELTFSNTNRIIIIEDKIITIEGKLK